MLYLQQRWAFALRFLVLPAAFVGLGSVVSGCGDDGGGSSDAGSAADASNGGSSGPSYGIQLRADPAGALSYRYDLVVCRTGESSCRDAETVFAMSGGTLPAGSQGIIRIVEDAETVETIKIAVEVTSGNGELLMILGEGDEDAFGGSTELREDLSPGDLTFELTPE